MSLARAIASPGLNSGRPLHLGQRACSWGLIHHPFPFRPRCRPTTPFLSTKTRPPPTKPVAMATPPTLPPPLVNSLHPSISKCLPTLNAGPVTTPPHPLISSPPPTSQFTSPMLGHIWTNKSLATRKSAPILPIGQSLMVAGPKISPRTVFTFWQREIESQPVQVISKCSKKPQSDTSTLPRTTTLGSSFISPPCMARSPSTIKGESGAGSRPLAIMLYSDGPTTKCLRPLPGYMMRCKMLTHLSLSPHRRAISSLPSAPHGCPAPRMYSWKNSSMFDWGHPVRRLAHSAKILVSL